MVSEIRIYAEGGGDQKDTKAFFREGLSKFLGSIVTLARLRRIRWQLIACGPRDAAYENFKNALAGHPESFNVLLVDSEGPVTTKRWAHLHWNACGTTEEHVHLMVQLMESWFLADQECLEAFYGQGFVPNRIPANPNVESIHKDIVIESLITATRNTQKGEYHKIRHASKLLGLIEEGRVRQRCPHCEVLFHTLSNIIQNE